MNDDVPSETVISRCMDAAAKRTGGAKEFPVAPVPPPEILQESIAMPTPVDDGSSAIDVVRHGMKAPRARSFDFQFDPLRSVPGPGIGKRLLEIFATHENDLIQRLMIDHPKRSPRFWAVRTDAVPLLAVPLPCISEDPLSVPTAKQDDAVATLIVDEAVMVSARRTCGIALSPLGTVPNPGIRQ
jgi:hypothetical protein